MPMTGPVHTPLQPIRAGMAVLEAPADRRIGSLVSPAIILKPIYAIAGQLSWMVAKF
jgi:hypothetical protein